MVLVCLSAHPLPNALTKRGGDTFKAARSCWQLTMFARASALRGAGRAMRPSNGVQTTMKRQMAGGGYVDGDTLNLCMAKNVAN